MFKIHYDSLIKYYPQTDLNIKLVSFYNDWKSRYLKLIENSSPSKEYIYYALDQPTSNNAVTVSEAMGYGMTIFALMSKFDETAKKHFSNLYNYVISFPSFYNKNLMAWQQIKNSDGNIINAEPETSSATDGDMEISYALLFAYKIWGEKDEINYKAAAITRVKALMESCVNKTDHILTLGDWVEGIQNNNFKFVTRCSDFITYHIKEFIKFDAENSAEWKLVLQTINSIISSQMDNLSRYTGLIPDFLIKDNLRYIPPKGKILESEHDGDYYYNSCRIPWRYSMDILLNDAPVTSQLSILNSWIKNSSFYNPSNIKSGYYIVNNYPGKPFGTSNNLSFIAPFLVSSLIEKGHVEWTMSLWNYLLKRKITECTFYENTLKLIAMIVATKNW